VKSIGMKDFKTAKTEVEQSFVIEKWKLNCEI
jgi:hypothetical protein